MLLHLMGNADFQGLLVMLMSTKWFFKTLPNPFPVRARIGVGALEGRSRYF